jgi:hypothetical protein
MDVTWHSISIQHHGKFSFNPIPYDNIASIGSLKTDVMDLEALNPLVQNNMTCPKCLGLPFIKLNF